MIIKSAVIGSLGFLVLENPLYVTDQYQKTINKASGWVFGLVDEISTDTKPGDLGADGENKTDDDFIHPEFTDEDGDRSAISGIAYTLWRSYVHEPFIALQIDSTADMDDPNSKAFKNGRDLLNIKYPDDRRNFLCEIAECPLLWDRGGGNDDEEGDGGNDEGSGDGDDNGEGEEDGGGIPGAQDLFSGGQD